MTRIGMTILQNNEMVYWSFMAILGSVLFELLPFALSNCADPQYCKFGGTCFNSSGNLLCRCLDGYVGNQCRNHLDMCKEANYCLNNGICYMGRCMCSDGFSGEHCERMVPRFRSYLLAGCAELPEFCALRFADGRCDKECDDVKCFFDGFDCDKEVKKACGKECALIYQNLKCDLQCSGSECGFDGGDCISSPKEEENPIFLKVEASPAEVCKNLRLMSAEIAQTLYAPVHLKLRPNIFPMVETDGGLRDCLAAHSIGGNSTQSLKLALYIDSPGCIVRSLALRSSASPCFSDPSSAIAFLHTFIRRQGFKDSRLKRIRIEGFSALESENPHFPNWLPVVIFSAFSISLFIGIFGFSSILKQRFCPNEISASVWKIPAFLSEGDVENKRFSLSMKRNGTSRKRKFKNEEGTCGVYVSTSFDLLSEKRDSNKSICTVYMEPSAHEPDLLHATRLNSPEMVQLLLSRGDQASCRDADGNTALHHAVAVNNFHIVQMLLNSYSCDLNARNVLGQTALMLALKLPEVLNEHVRILFDFMVLERGQRLAAFKEHSSTIVVPCRNYCTCVTSTDHNSAEKEFHPAVSEEDSLHVTDCFGRSVLHYAALSNRFKLIPLLVAYGAELNIRDEKGETPLHLAARSGFFEVVNTLMSLGADASIDNQLGRSPFYLASENGHFTVACFIENYRRRGQSSEPLAGRSSPKYLLSCKLYASKSAQCF